MTEVNTALQGLLSTVIVAVIAALGSIAVAYIGVLKQKALASLEAIQDDNARKALKDAVNRVDDIVCTVVTAIEQEEKQEVLKALEDGEVTRDELLSLKDVAVDRVKQQLLPDMVDLLEDAFGDLSEYISQRVSQEVFTLKQDTDVAMLEAVE